MSDLSAQLEFLTDHQAEPVDHDAALARFLLSLVRSEDSTGWTSPAESDQHEVAER